MFSLRLLWLMQLCILPFLVYPYPHEILENLVKEYTAGIENLQNVIRDVKYEEGNEDLLKIAYSETTEEPEEYDFIVIGGGTSGSVIANRLSEVPEWHVLLLESGKEESKVGQIPAMAEALQLSEYNWGYKTEPQQHACLGMVNQQCPIHRGKSLGGSSSINSMVYTRGNVLDYDRWADEELRSWCYNDVLPYFKKSEDLSIHQFDTKYHNKGGLLSVEDVQYRTPLAETFLEAGKELGIPTVDYNGRHQLGFGLTQANTKHGKRHSASTAFLGPASHRKNLKISPYSYVTQILIGDHTLEAKGVKYIKDNKLHVAKARKEVILAAGTINSPQILMLSGIGPKEELEHLGIPTKVDLHGLGKNLQDHNVYMGLNFLVNETEILHRGNGNENLKLWLSEGKGPLTMTNNIEGIGFIKTKVSKEEKDYPDVELMFSSRPFDTHNGEIFKRSTSLSDETYTSIYKPLEGHYIWSISPILLHPKSVGQISIKSKNPFHWPKIQTNYFTDPDDHDAETMVEGIKKALEISKTDAFHKWGSKLLEAPVPGCAVHEYGSHDYWKCSVRSITRSANHQIGTCKMGTKTDKSAVVDEHLNVYGVKGLRVADASVIPSALSGHIHAAVLMIGEKAADLIKTTWK